MSNTAWEYADLERVFNMAGNRMRRWRVLMPQTSFENTKLVVDQFPHPLDPDATKLRWETDTTRTGSLPLGMVSWATLDPSDQSHVHWCLAGLSALQGAATPRLRVNHLTLVNDRVTLGVTGFEYLSQQEIEFVFMYCMDKLTIGSDGTFYLNWLTRVHSARSGHNQALIQS